MLHRLKGPEESAAKFLAQWFLGKMGKVKKDHTSGLECFTPLPTDCVYFTLQHNIGDPSQGEICQLFFKVSAASRNKTLLSGDCSSKNNHIMEY